MTDKVIDLSLHSQNVKLDLEDNGDDTYSPTVVLSAGEDHAGEVSGNTVNISVIPVITSGVYHANDVVGSGYQTIANASRLSGKPTTLQSLVITDLGMQNASLYIFLFSQPPTSGTYTDNSECDIDDTDLGYCVGVIFTSAGTWVSAKDNSVFTMNNIGLPITPSGTSLYAIVKCAAAPTFTSTSDLKFIYGFYRD